MITLITGAPGAGKTSALVSILADLKGQRAVYVHGIPDLKIEHQQLTNPETWFDDVPDGSLIVIDEVQTIWRPTSPGQKIPPSIARLETHRHNGLDFYILTQGPNLVHANVRALVGRHIHLRDLGVLGRWWYEWAECCDNVRTGWKNAPVSKRYKLPKKIFDQYKSASVHIKPKRSIPPRLIIVALCVLFVVFMSFRVYSNIYGKTEEPVTEVKGTQSVEVVQPSDEFRGTKKRVFDDVADFMPRHRNMPWSAPAYEEIKQVKALPTITGAICIDEVCKCYHGPGYLRDVSSEACSDWVKDRPFDPYQEPAIYAADGLPPSDKQRGPVQAE